MKYQSGEQVQLNDNVLVERCQTPGVVECIIETELEMNEWRTGERGVLLKSPPFGSVFWPIENIDDPVIFVSRVTT